MAADTGDVVGKVEVVRGQKFRQLERATVRMTGANIHHRVGNGLLDAVRPEQFAVGTLGNLADNVQFFPGGFKANGYGQIS